MTVCRVRWSPQESHIIETNLVFYFILNGNVYIESLQRSEAIIRSCDANADVVQENMASIY